MKPKSSFSAVTFPRPLSQKRPSDRKSSRETLPRRGSGTIFDGKETVEIQKLYMERS